MTTNIMDRIPEVFRKPLRSPELITTLLPFYVQNLDPEIAVGFIEGAIKHQETVGEDNEMGEGDTGWKWFKGEVTKIEEFDRKSKTSDWTIGTKATVHLTSSFGDEEIDTGWIEYNGYDKGENAWEVALSRTIRAIAEEAMEQGKEVLLCKLVFPTTGANGKKVKARMLVDIKMINSGGSDKDSDKTSGKKAKSRKKSGKGKEQSPEELFRDKVLDAVEEFDPDELLKDEDIDDIVGLMVDSNGDFKDNDEAQDVMAEFLDLDVEDLELPSDDEEADSWSGYLVQLLVLNP